MTGAKHNPGGRHATLFLDDFLYISFWKNIVYKQMYFQIMISVLH